MFFLIIRRFRHLKNWKERLNINSILPIVDAAQEDGHAPIRPNHEERVRNE